ncbi:hypothetical protein ACFL0A_01450 [Patescibacteria group bacterium]
MLNLLYKTIIIFSIVGLLLPSFTFAKQQPPIEAPETLDQAKEMGIQAGQELQKSLPEILKRIWEEEVLPLWNKMWNWAKNLWNSFLWPKIENIFKGEVEPRLKEEIEKRKPIIEEEFKKEKEELIEELPEVGKSLWERFKELIK